MVDYTNFLRQPHNRPAPRVSVMYVPVPMWPEQLGTFERFSVIANCPVPPLITICALAFVGTHTTRDGLVRDFVQAQRVYAERGKNVKLPFRL